MPAQASCGGSGTTPHSPPANGSASSCESRASPPAHGLLHAEPLTDSETPTGKNNGSVNGEAYFECEPNYGVFVRPSQVQFVEQPKRAVRSSPHLISELS